jgi:hypothetical protein
MGMDRDDDLEETVAESGEQLQHVGYRPERTIFDSGDLERAFAFAWLEKHRIFGSDHLQSLLSSGDPFGETVVTQRDASVAATIIQWLGTNCGWGFLCQVLRKHGQYEVVDLEAKRKLEEILGKTE